MSFQFGDKVTYLNEKAIFIYGNTESVNVARPYRDAVSLIQSDKITAGWPPEVYEGESLVGESLVFGAGPLLTGRVSVYIPRIFSGKKVKVRVEEILE